VDAVTYFKWNRAADVLAPLLFKSLGESDTSSIISVEIREFGGCETFPQATQIGDAVLVGYKLGWVRVWDGGKQLKGEKGQQYLWKHSNCTISFTDKAITDIAALVYGFDEGTEQ